MKKLLALLLIFGIIGCQKEPTLLDKCIETNVNLFETTSMGDDLKIVFQPDLDVYIDYMRAGVDLSDIDNKDWCMFDYVARDECSNLEPKLFYSKYGDILYADSKEFYETINVSEIKEWIQSKELETEIAQSFHQILLKDTYHINASLKCSEQGIY